MPALTITIKLKVGKGSQGESCPSFGVCHASIEIGSDTKLSYDSELNQMSFSIPQETIKKEQPEKLPYFEGHTSVTFEEDYTFNDEIQQALKSDHPLTIPPQTCPLTSRDGNYIIDRIRLK